MVGISTTPLTKGEIEVQLADENAIDRFRQQWPIMKLDPDWVITWLQRQYVGEMDALATMRQLIADYAEQVEEPKFITVVKRITSDEERHVDLIVGLLRTRQVEPSLEAEPVPLEGIASWDTGSAITSRAEAIRLAELRVVLDDPDLPEDVRAAFTQVFRDEHFHERAFRAVTSEEALAITWRLCSQGGNQWCA